MREEKFQLYLPKHPSVAYTGHTVEGLRFITDIIPPDKYTKMLDIGCAEGRETKVLYDLGYDVIGITQGRLNVEYAKENYPEIVAIEMDMHDLRFHSNTFDAIYTNHTYEHAIAPYVMLLEMYAVIKTKGRIWINVPFYAEEGDTSYAEGISVISYHHPNILPPNIYRRYFNLFFNILELPPHITGNCYLLEPKPFETLHSDIQTLLREREAL